MVSLLILGDPDRGSYILGVWDRQRSCRGPARTGIQVKALRLGEVSQSCWVPVQLGDFSGPGHHLPRRASRSLPHTGGPRDTMEAWRGPTPGSGAWASRTRLALGVPGSPAHPPTHPRGMPPSLTVGHARFQSPNSRAFGCPPLECRTGTQPMKQMFSAPSSPREEGESKLFSFCLPWAFP